MTSTKMEYRNAAQAFDAAIAAGVLSADQSSERYAGAYMYMCTVSGEDQFKNITTRQYLRSLTPGFVDVGTVTEYGLTQKLSSAVRCF